MTEKNITVSAIRDYIRATPARSAWSRGINAYCFELLDELQENITGGWTSPSILATPAAIEAALLNGARDWKQYSHGGAALIFDGDIATRLCTPTELKRTRNGERPPNNRESWLDVQARALFQASQRIKYAALEVSNA